MKRVRLLGISKLVTFICLALIGASLIGCQGWWNRSSKSKSILGFASEQSSDDWEHPQAPAGTTSLNPRTRTPANNVASSGNTKSRYNAVSDNERREELSSQRVVLPRDRNKVSKAEANAADIQSSRPPVAELPPSTPPVSQAVAATPPTTDSTPATSPVITASATAPTNSTVETTKPSIPDTGKDQVDTEGALNLLHPEHQAAMRKKIESNVGSLSKPAGKTNIDSAQSLGAEPSKAGVPDLKTPDYRSEDPNRWSQTLNQSVVALERLLSSADAMDPAVRNHHEMTLRLLYLAQRNLEQAQRSIDGLSEREQEYVHHQLAAWYLASSPDANPSRPRHWSQVMEEQKIANRQLAALSTLHITNVAFCTQVDGYGTINKFAKNSFRPDQDVLLYCELENVTSEKVREGYESRVRGTYEIRDAQGKRVVEQVLPMEPDVCTNERRDFFLVYKIYMPAAIDAGRYELLLTMEDLHGNKFAHGKSEFEIKK